MRIGEYRLGPRVEREDVHLERRKGNPLRAQIEEDVAAFLANGGEILPAPPSVRLTARVVEGKGARWTSSSPVVDAAIARGRRGAKASWRSRAGGREVNRTP